MTVLRTLVYSSDTATNRLAHLWNLWRFLLLQRPRHRQVELGEGVRFHVPVRGGIGRLKVGKHVVFGYPLAHKVGSGAIMVQARTAEASISIGAGTMINNNSALCALEQIEIGENCRIGSGVEIVDSDFHEMSPATRNRSNGIIKPVSIGNNVWIGNRAMILKGARIGDNSVIGAMSLVTGEIPANCVAAGVPARVISELQSQSPTGIRTAERGRASKLV
jgi:maltose O-acetyltransferase